MAKKRISSSEAEIRRFMKDPIVRRWIKETWGQGPKEAVMCMQHPTKMWAIYISPFEFIEKRQNLKGVTRRLRKAIRGKR